MTHTLEYTRDYRAKHKELMNERSRLSMQDRRTRHAKKRVKCRACNKTFWSLKTSAILCPSCKKIHKKIDMRVYLETKKHHQFENVIDSVNVSDFKFSTDLCDMNCDKCKFDDCVLPEE
jgi:phage FluMu protein Com